MYMQSLTKHQHYLPYELNFFFLVTSAREQKNPVVQHLKKLN